MDFISAAAAGNPGMYVDDWPKDKQWLCELNDLIRAGFAIIVLHNGRIALYLTDEARDIALDALKGNN